jgi:hypothetical protein
VHEHYQLLEQLGAGSSSQVFLAKNRLTGALVAIKQLKALSNPAVKIRFQREFRAMQRLEHPGIVRVLDFFEHESHPWLVMEYVEGCDLSQWLQTPRDLAEVLKVFVALSSALEAVHREGMVHRDIKPQNIFIRAENNAPVLFDFGLVKQADQLGISRDGTMIGTVLYMSPEQCRSLAVDSRADLYALGVVLYQALCGRPVFEGNTIPEVVNGHLSRSPVSPRFYRPDLPQQLEDLMLVLLAKNPSVRMQRAVLVRTALEGILEGRAAWQAPTHLPEVSMPLAALQLSAQALFVAPLIGRDAELLRLRRAVDTQTGVIAICGEAGLGKTRLVQALELTKGISQLIRVEGQRNDSPYGLIARALAEALELMPESFSRLSAQDRQELSVLLPSLGATMWFSSFQGLERDQGLFAAVAGWLDYTRHSLLLAFENLQYADSSSLKLLKHVLDLNPRLRIIVSYQPEFQPELGVLPAKTVISLKPLSGVQLRQLLPAWLGVEVNTVIAEDLIVRAEGNPWVLEELVKTALELNTWEEGPQIDFALTNTPSKDGLSGMRSVLERRLADLPSDALELAQAAAVLGSEIRFSHLPQVLAWSEARVLDGVESLLKARVLRESNRPDDERLSFTHSLYANVLHDLGSLERRRELHARIALVMANQFDALQYIEHLSGAEQWQDVLRVADNALENPSSAPDFERLLLLAINALEHVPPTFEHNKIRAAYAAFLLRSARVDAAERHWRIVFRKVVGQVGWHDLEFKARIQLAHCLALQAKEGEALFLLERPDAGFDRDGSLLLERAALYAQTRDWIAARRDGLVGLARARTTGTVQNVVRALGQLAVVQSKATNELRSKRLLEFAQHIASQSGLVDVQASVQLLTAQVLLGSGQFVQAATTALGVADHSQETGLQIDAKEILIRCFETQHQYEQARQLTLELRRLCTQLGWNAKVQDLNCQLALQSTALEDFDAALEYARVALPMPRATSLECLLAFCLGAPQTDAKTMGGSDPNLEILLKNLRQLERHEFDVLQPATTNSNRWTWWISLTQLHAAWHKSEDLQAHLKNLRGVQTEQYISPEQLEDYHSFLTLATSSDLKPETEAFVLTLAQVYAQSHIGVFARDFVRSRAPKTEPAKSLG